MIARIIAQREQYKSLLWRCIPFIRNGRASFEPSSEREKLYGEITNALATREEEG